MKSDLNFQASRCLPTWTKSALVLPCLLAITVFSIGCEDKTKLGETDTNPLTNTPTSSVERSAAQPAPTTDPELIEAIRNLANKCNTQVFKESDCGLTILLFEWRKIEADVSKIYHKRFPERPKPAGSFLRDLVFYSHNKHFEWLVAEALIGDSRKHCEFQRSMMATPFYPERLNQDFMWNGTEQPDYDKLGTAIKGVFEQERLSGVSVDANMRKEFCVVSSEWKTLKEINGIKYQNRTQHTVKETTGLTIAPGRYYKGDSSRLQFITSICVRDRSKAGNDEEKFGPLACSLFATDNQTPRLDTDLNNWYVADCDKLTVQNIQQDSFESQPNLEYRRKIASNWKQDRNHETIENLQKAIAEQVK